MDDHIGRLIVMAILTMLRGIFAAAAAAMENCSEGTLKRQAEEGDKRAELLQQMLKQSGRYITAVELALTGATLAIGVLFSQLSCRAAAERLSTTLFGKREVWFVAAFLILAALLLLFLVFLLGGLLPRKLALRNSERCLSVFYGLLRAVGVLFYPMLFLLRKGTRFFLWLLRIRPEELEENVTEEEIISIVNEGQEQGILEAEEAEMISNIIEFDEKTAGDIMTHRKKMVGIPLGQSIEEAMRFALSENYSRFLLYEGDIDDIRGILHIRDIMQFYMDERLRTQPLLLAASEPYFVPETQSIHVLLQDMQSKKVHMAVVVDEYGQTAGIVTMEDILEEIVGDIQDEYDEEEVTIFDQGDQTWLVMGEASLEELAEKTGLEIGEEEFENYDTVNGLLISRLDRIPGDGETAQIVYAGFQFEVLDTQNKVIRMVRVQKLPEEEPKEEA